MRAGSAARAAARPHPMPAPIAFLLENLERDLVANDLAGVIASLDPESFAPRILFLEADRGALPRAVRDAIPARIPIKGPLRRPFWNVGLIRRFLLAVGDTKPAVLFVSGGRDVLAFAPRVIGWLEKPAVYLAPSGDPAFPWDQRKSLDAFGRIVATTGRLTLRLVDELSIAEKTVATIYPGIDVDRFDFRPLDFRALAESEAPLVGVVGSPPAATTAALHAALASTPGSPRLAAPGAREPLIDLGDAWSPEALARVAMLLLLPDSDWETGFDTLLRGMAVGRAAIAAVPSARIDDLIQNGETGLLLVTDDPRAVSNAVAGLLSKPELLASMGAAGRMRVAGEFERGRWLAEYEALIRISGGIPFPAPKPRGPEPSPGASPIKFGPS